MSFNALHCNCKLLQSGVVIIDPLTNQMQGFGYSVTDEHPMKHAVMVAIDSVARGQGGGVWETTDTCSHRCELCNQTVHCITSYFVITEIRYMK